MGMALKRALAANVAALMRYHPNLDTQAKLARAAGLGQGSVSRVLNADAGVTLDTLSAIGRAFDLMAYQLLIPELDPANPPSVAVTAAERELHRRLQTVAREFVKQGGLESNDREGVRAVDDRDNTGKSSRQGSKTRTKARGA